MLKSAAREAAELKWNDGVLFMDNILDIKPDIKTVIIGTLYKEQTKKPNVFHDLESVIKTNSAVDLSFGNKGLNGEETLCGKFISDEDKAILEDSSGRISIRTTATFRPQEYVTGSIIALLGSIDSLGYFIVEDTCLPGIPFNTQIP